MRLVLMDFMSLDGVCQAPGGPEEDRDGDFANGGWSHPYFDVEAMGPFIEGATGSADALLYGRRTYAVMAGAWPARAGDPFADRMNAIPKYVASRTYSEADVTWSNTTLLLGDGVAAVAELKARPGGDLLMWGSTDFARQLVAGDLIDEYVLLLEPILVGGGKGIFPADGVSRPLQLLSAQPVSTGVIMCRYAPAAPSTAPHAFDQMAAQRAPKG